jgi:hypothetical protein
MRYGLAIGALLLLSQTTIAAMHPRKQSEFRPGVSVEFVHFQKLEGVYHTAWWGRLEKRDGEWRDVYFETAEKYVNNGLMSFKCLSDKSNIGVIMYHGGEYGSGPGKEVVTVRPNQRANWAKEEFEPLSGEDPPYKLYLSAKKRFC